MRSRCSRRRCAARRAPARSPPGCAGGWTSSASTATCTRAPKVLRTTTTRTDALIAVERGRITGLRAGARLAPRILARGPVVRAALVPTQAGPLDGDHDRVRLHV